MRLQHYATALTLSLASIPFIALGQTGVTTQQYKQTDLVADSTATAADATTIDPNLVGGWGISESSGGPWWVSDNGSGLSTLYNGVGARQSLVVTVPTADPNVSKTGTPTGVVFNSNPANFVLPDGRAATFIFATLDGLIAGWNSAVPNNTAQIAANRAATSSYTGLAVAGARVNGTVGTYLYAADFKTGAINVFNNRFKRAVVLEKAIAAIVVPSGYAPFGIQNIGGNLYVTLARADNSTGPGQGIVAAITPEGKLLGSLEGGEYLNAPWGITLAPGNFGNFSHSLLVGNNGDGKINAFNPLTGRFIATLVDATNAPISINGLWGLSFGNDTANGGPATTLYFAAAPGTGGLFGSLTPIQNANGSNR